MDSTQQAKWLQEQIKAAKSALGQMPDGIEEDEVILRFKAVESLLAILHHDAFQMHADWVEADKFLKESGYEPA
jgi:hypothetical protein